MPATWPDVLVEGFETAFLRPTGLARAAGDYHHHSRTHLSIDKDAPETRPVQDVGTGRNGAVPQVGGLHHRYECQAA
jgi:hypothetical protein